MAAPIRESVEVIAGQRIVVLRVDGFVRDDSTWGGVGWRPLHAVETQNGQTVALTAIPYALWANRGSSVMRIFIPAHAAAAKAAHT